MHFYGLDQFVKGCESAKRAEWVNDHMRHTAITYRLKRVKHEGEVADWAGTSPEMIKKHYKSVKGVTKKSTKEFYSLTPSKIINSIK